MGAAGARNIALTLAAVDAVGVLGLILLSMLGDPFAMVNDAAKAAVGALSAALAWAVFAERGRRWPAGQLAVGLGASAVGGGIMIIGSVLVALDVSGWYFAAMVSSVGAA